MDDPVKKELQRLAALKRVRQLGIAERFLSLLLGMFVTTLILASKVEECFYLTVVILAIAVGAALIVLFLFVLKERGYT